MRNEEGGGRREGKGILSNEELGGLAKKQEEMCLPTHLFV